MTYLWEIGPIMTSTVPTLNSRAQEEKKNKLVFTYPRAKINASQADFFCSLVKFLDKLFDTFKQICH